MIVHETFGAGNFTSQNWTTLSGAAAASRAGYRAARRPTAEGPTAGPVAGPGPATPGS